MTPCRAAPFGTNRAALPFPTQTQRPQARVRREHGAEVFLNRFVWCSARAAKASAASHVGCEAIAARAASTAIVELWLLLE